MSDHPQLPPPTFDLRPLADLLGLENLLILLEKRGGTRLQVPQSVERSHIVADLGEPIVAALVAAHGGTRLKIPLGREWRVQVYARRGMSYTAIAIRLGLTEDGVWRSLKAASLTAGRRSRGGRAAGPTEPPRQSDLIDWLQRRS